MKNKSLFLSGFFVLAASFGCLSAMAEEPQMQEEIDMVEEPLTQEECIKKDDFTSDMMYIIREFQQILKSMDSVNLPSIESVKKAIESAQKCYDIILIEKIGRGRNVDERIFAFIVLTHVLVDDFITDIGKERPDLKEISEHLEIYMTFLFLQKAFARDFAFKELNISVDELSIEITSLKKLCDKLKNNEFNEEIVRQIDNMFRAQLKSEGRVECQKVESLYEKILSSLGRKLECNSLFKEYESLFKEITTIYFSQMCDALQKMIRLNIALNFNHGVRIEKMFDEGAVKCALSMYPEIAPAFYDRVTQKCLLPLELR
ncbi:MAG: hypothetical protein US69_C0012G0027 [candidate division TM6 bacterium GW2011_GWF2_38_10]|nr:MAG: hypothetical protein US69_C0012G0027 [candidate division TM6 bacterium GW2011_GWF2_38_10]